MRQVPFQVRMKAVKLSFFPCFRFASADEVVSRELISCHDQVNYGKHSVNTSCSPVHISILPHR